jgi:non-specific protein-tyrosine kinase
VEGVRAGTGVGSVQPGPPEVPALAEPTSPAAEAYRTLRTSVQFLSLKRPVRTLMITSPNAGDGKTTTIANLGVVFARAGVPVTVVSCDLRRPTLHEAFGLSNTVGFTSVLLGQVSAEDALQTVPNLERLTVMAAGPIPPNPSELLSLRKASDVFVSLAASGRVVLVDAPPVLPVSDALVLANRVDAVLLVCVAGMTTRKDAARAVELLSQVDAPLVGTILNGASEPGGYGYSYRYYGAAHDTAASGTGGTGGTSGTGGTGGTGGKEAARR